MENKEIIELFVKCILAFMSVVLTSYVIPWIKSKLGAEQTKMLMDFIEKCVEAAEKLYLPEEKITKKNYVMDLARGKLAELGINMTDEALNALVEGFVKSVKG